MLSQLHGLGGKGIAQGRHRFVRIAVAAHKYIDGGKSALWPSMNADVGFGEDDDARNATAVLKTVKVCVQNSCTGISGRIA